MDLGLLLMLKRKKNTFINGRLFITTKVGLIDVLHQ